MYKFTIETDKIEQMPDMLIRTINAFKLLTTKPEAMAAADGKSWTARPAEEVPTATPTPVEAPAQPNDAPWIEQAQAVPTVPMQPTVADVKQALIELRKVKGAEAVRAILNAHNAKDFQSLDASSYQDVMKEAANAAK